jgi:hypothetical protein
VVVTVELAAALELLVPQILVAAVEVADQLIMEPPKTAAPVS